MNREVSKEFRPSTWITDVVPRKSPFVPQMGDEVRDCLDHMASLLLCVFGVEIRRLVGGAIGIDLMERYQTYGNQF
jgi:hypothetical protein